MISLKIDMLNPVLVCGSMKFLLIKPCKVSFLKLKTKPVEGDDLIGYSKVIWMWPLSECSQIITVESNGAKVGGWFKWDWATLKTACSDLNEDITDMTTALIQNTKLRNNIRS